MLIRQALLREERHFATMAGSLRTARGVPWVWAVALCAC
jgi:hypothetical protein